jgi:hypothetical protein
MKPHPPKPETATNEAANTTAANLLTGAAPVVRADSFESRWAPATH